MQDSSGGGFCNSNEFGGNGDRVPSHDPAADLFLGEDGRYRYRLGNDYFGTKPARLVAESLRLELSGEMRTSVR